MMGRILIIYPQCNLTAKIPLEIRQDTEKLGDGGESVTLSEGLNWPTAGTEGQRHSCPLREPLS